MIKLQKGFTLIELMVVIVIIGILAALAIPKMLGVSNKAKAGEAPSVIANWETLQSAYAQETGAAGAYAAIGFVDPTAASMWLGYTDGTTMITAAAPTVAFGLCGVGAAVDSWVSTYTVTTDVNVHTEVGDCPEAYTPNFD